FVRHGLKREYTEINIDRLFDFAKSEGLETKKENGKIVIDLRSYKHIKILGRGKITVPLKIILNNTARISDIAKEKIENSGGEIVIAE
ncbi:MAG: uL15m family ribosomal protein, partial [Candidatus Njordarchaeota archaeon]